MLQRKSWSKLEPRQRAAISLAGLVQVGLLIAALYDIRRRPENEINGSKRMWTAISFINYIGPLAYFFFGRKCCAEAES